MAVTKSAPYSPPPVAKKTVSATKITQPPHDDTTRVHKSRTEALAGISEIVSGGLTIAGLGADAGAVRKSSPGIIEGLVRYADKNDKFGEWIDGSETAGPVLMVVMAVMGLGAQIAVNHKLFGATPEKFAALGVVAPDQLKADNHRALLAAQEQAFLAMKAQEESTIRAYAEYEAVRAQAEAVRNSYENNPDGPSDDTHDE